MKIITDRPLSRIKESGITTAVTDFHTYVFETLRASANISSAFFVFINSAINTAASKNYTDKIFC